MATPGEIADTGSPVRLTKAASDFGVDSSGIGFPELSLIRQRWAMIIVICAIFILLNGVVCWLVNKTIDLEFDLLQAGIPIAANERIITNGVFMSLIGATVVQTGLVIRAVADFLFKDGNKKDSG